MLYLLTICNAIRGLLDLNKNSMHELDLSTTYNHISLFASKYFE